MYYVGKTRKDFLTFTFAVEEAKKVVKKSKSCVCSIWDGFGVIVAVITDDANSVTVHDLRMKHPQKMEEDKIHIDCRSHHR